MAVTEVVTVEVKKAKRWRFYKKTGESSYKGKLGTSYSLFRSINSGIHS